MAATCVVPNCNRRPTRQFVIDPSGVDEVSTAVGQPLQAGPTYDICWRHSREINRRLGLVPARVDDRRGQQLDLAAWTKWERLSVSPWRREIWERDVYRAYSELVGSSIAFTAVGGVLAASGQPDGLIPVAIGLVLGVPAVGARRAWKRSGGRKPPFKPADPTL